MPAHRIVLEDTAEGGAAGGDTKRSKKHRKEKERKERDKRGKEKKDKQAGSLHNTAAPSQSRTYKVGTCSSNRIGQGLVSIDSE